MLRILILLLVLLFAFQYNLVLAVVDLNYKYVIPDSMKTTEDFSKLRSYLSSKWDTERVGACLRLTEIGGEQASELLKEAFEKEPYKLGSEPTDGVNYYALLGIGKIGGLRAEEYLNSIIEKYVRPKYNRGNHADTITTINGALDGLFEIGSESSISTIDKVYKSKDIYWLVRSFAYKRLLMHQLRSEDINTSADTANFFVNELRNCEEYPKHNDDKSNVRAAYIEYYSIRYLIYIYKKITLPYLDEYISGLPDNEIRTEDLRNLRDRMRASLSR
ncbi:MAG: hypothetical protein GY855_15915 [candidate division Zixibacteria bacterium]|nr:hypothetical protein [candidate division Zixibacteria bacterium]